MERFIGVLIEHFAGAFPTWLAPEQVRVLPISEKTNDYARHIRAALLDRRLRAGIDESGDRIQAKIKAATGHKIPYLLVVGPTDEQQRVVSVRARGVRRNLGALPLDAFLESIEAEVTTRGDTTVLTRHFETAVA
jgi:threonyl-tRNA synthetase